MRGSALESLLKYADRVSYAYKGKLDKHAEINHPRPQGFMILLQRVFLDTHERLATMKIIKGPGDEVGTFVIKESMKINNSNVVSVTKVRFLVYKKVIKFDSEHVHPQ